MYITISIIFKEDTMIKNKSKIEIGDQLQLSLRENTSKLIERVKSSEIMRVWETDLFVRNKMREGVVFIGIGREVLIYLFIY